MEGKSIYNQAIFFARDKKAIDRLVTKLDAKLAADAVMWIAYPKKSGSIKSDISRDNGWELVTAAGYDPVTQVAIDNDWSALRFRKSEAIGDKLRDIPMAERQTEGIDYVKRTAILPADAAKALKPYKGLETFFNSMSFSHKKEYVQAIVEAKKPDTRQRRIEKMIGMLQELQHAKAIKTKR